MDSSTTFSPELLRQHNAQAAFQALGCRIIYRLSTGSSKYFI